MDGANDILTQTLHSQNQQHKTKTTVITIAHKLQTIMDADQIIYLENGHIIEQGTKWHAPLRECCSPARALCT